MSTLLGNHSMMLPVDYPVAERPANRRVPLRGTRNTRDLGGYPTADGKTVRWGVLYRSDRLSKLRKRDTPLFNKMNLHSVVDLRSDYERDKSPDKLPDGHPINLVEIPILDEGNEMIGKDLVDRITKGDIAGIDPAAMLIGANREFVADFKAEYRTYLQTLLASDGMPVLWHCTSGKDRAGFAAALILSLLGVPEDVIFEDYLLTNRFIKPSLWKEFLVLRLIKGRGAYEIVQGFSVAREEFLRMAFNTVQSEFGSFDTYIRDGLGITEPEIAQFKSWYLV